MKRTELESLVLTALSQQLMNDNLFEEFCKEYSKHTKKLMAQQSSNLNAYHLELKQIETANENLMNSIESGIPV